MIGILQWMRNGTYILLYYLLPYIFTLLYDMKYHIKLIKSYQHTPNNKKERIYNKCKNYKNSNKYNKFQLIMKNSLNRANKAQEQDIEFNKMTLQILMM